jgi:hypothetical protein
MLVTKRTVLHREDGKDSEDSKGMVVKTARVLKTARDGTAEMVVKTARMVLVKAARMVVKTARDGCEDSKDGSEGCKDGSENSNAQGEG